ncbi:MAG: PIN domain-containing protein [Anaerolineales bacterium]|nr:PIN domain-containing protein [Anaerolineales bacterium]
MTTYMVDTHSLLWAFHKPGKLGKEARRAFEEAANGESRLLIPVMVLAELIFTIENKPVQADLEKILFAIQNSPNIDFVDFDYETALQLRNLTAIPEMHDRIIVAAAIEHEATLITFDKTIRESGLVDVVW